MTDVDLLSQSRIDIMLFKFSQVLNLQVVKELSHYSSTHHVRRWRNGLTPDCENQILLFDDDFSTIIDIDTLREHGWYSGGGGHSDAATAEVIPFTVYRWINCPLSIAYCPNARGLAVAKVQDEGFHRAFL